MWAMKYFWLLVVVLSLTACSSSRISHYDEFEKMKVDKLTGNSVSANVFSRTVVCLNAAGEQRFCRTDQHDDQLHHQLRRHRHHQSDGQHLRQRAGRRADQHHRPTIVDTNAPAVASTGNNGSSGVTTATARNESIATAPNQHIRSGSIQIVTTLNSRATLNQDSLALTFGTQ